MMPRRAAIVTPNIPLFMIPPVIRESVMNAGEELERIVVRKSNRHFYTVSVRTRSIKRELRSSSERMSL